LGKLLIGNIHLNRSSPSVKCSQIELHEPAPKLRQIAKLAEVWWEVM
jgi:hypothetical protein